MQNSKVCFAIVGYSNIRSSVQLQGGNVRNEGRVELSVGNWIGTICDNGFGEAEAKVVCRMLGHR